MPNAALKFEFEDDANVLESEDWQAQIAPHMQANVATTITAEEYRGIYGRPFKLMRTLAKLDEKQAAELLGWNLGEIAAAEDRDGKAASIPFMKYCAGMALLGLAAGHAHDSNYSDKAWAPALGESLGHDSLDHYMEFQTGDWKRGGKLA